MTKVEQEIISDWVAAGSSVLDLGCGDGELLSYLIREKRVRAQGIELSEPSVQACVAKGLSVFQEDIDTGLAEYADKSFDYVVLNQTFQQVKKPDFVLQEALRVGKRTIVGFPNFAHFRARIQIFFKGKVPITPALPYEWYDTPNLHFLSIADFELYCRKRDIRVGNRAFVGNNRRVRFFPNLLAEVGLFLASK